MFLENSDESALYYFFSNFIILEANFNQERNSIKYIAISKMFEEIEREHVPPEYYIHITKNDLTETKYPFNIRAEKISVFNFHLKDKRKYISRFNEETESVPLEKSENDPQTQAYPTLKEFLT